MPPAPAPAWQLRLLGQPALLAPGGSPPIGLRPKDALLLAVVALAGPVKAERLAAQLWPTATARQAEASLRQRLFRLRRATGGTLVVSSALLALAADLGTDLADALLAIRTDPQAGPGELLGELSFDELPDLADWLAAKRQKWRTQRDAVLAATAAQCEKAGAIALGLAYAQRLVDADPLAEHAQRRLMRLHYLRGDQASAIAVFERFEQRLKDELGARPAAETIELMATIERGAAQLPQRRAVAPASLLRPPHLVGRADELALLARAWAAGRVFLVIGEAGIGKTRLLQEFSAGRPGWVGVQARPGDAGIPYALLARLLRAVRAAFGTEPGPDRAQQLALVLPELGHAVALAGEAQRVLLQRAVDASLADALAQGLQALVVDDLHLADDASLDLLQSLVPSQALATLQWGFAQRPAPATPGVEQLRCALEEAGRIEPLPLQPLTLAQVTALVASVGLPELDPAGLAPALLQHTGGNPMFALETLKDLLLSGQAAGVAAGAAGSARLPQPVNVGALIERRLAQLSAPALRLARVAALAGPDFGAELAAAVLDVHPIDIAEPWRELELAQVIRDQAFAHDLIFEATLASVPKPIAQLLHQRIALHLQARQAPPERLAPHWAGAASWPQAGEAYAAAARRAQSASQRTHEVACWRLAAQAFELAGAPDRAFEARCDSVHALIVVHGVTHAQGVIEDLLAMARSDQQRAAAYTAQATAALMAADHQAGIAAAVQAGALSRRLASPWPGFQAACLQAVGLAQAGRTAEALATIEPCRALLDRDDAQPAQRGRFWADYAYVLNGARRLRDTGHALQQAINHAQALGDIAELATLTSNLATVHGNLGQVADALALAQHSMALQAQLGAADGPEGAVVATYLGLYCGMVGRYTEALQHLDAALACFASDQQPVWTAVAANHKAQFLIDLGQFARARQALAYPPPPLDHVRARGATIAARLERAQGRSGQAALQQALQWLKPGADPHVRMHVMLEAALQDEPEAAVARCDEVLAQARQLEFAGVALKAGLLRADALRRANRGAEAALAMGALVAQLPQLQPADMVLSQAWWLAAQVFEAAGAGEQGLIALGQGAHWLRHVALPQVPAEFRDSFLQRQPTHRALLAAADLRRLQ